MISLKKGPAPPILAKSAELWRDELLDFHKKSMPPPKELQTRYQHKEVKSALIAETHGKCMYCESKIAHVAYAHIEHYRPKANGMFPELTFEWLNLGLACPKCNHEKLDYFDEATPFINPYLDSPEIHFRASGPCIYAVPGNKRAELTELKLSLNRPELIERRREKLLSLHRLIRCYNMEDNSALKAAYLDQLHAEIGADREYSLASSEYVRLFVSIAS